MKTYYVYFYYFWHMCWYEFTNIKVALRFLREESKDKDVAGGEITLLQEGSRVEYKFVNGKRVKDEIFNIN